MGPSFRGFSVKSGGSVSAGNGFLNGRSNRSQQDRLGKLQRVGRRWLTFGTVLIAIRFESPSGLLAVEAPDAVQLLIAVSVWVASPCRHHWC